MSTIEQTKENIAKYVSVEKSNLGDKVWVVNAPAGALSPKDMQEIRDAAMAKGATVREVAADKNAEIRVPSGPSVKEQAQIAARGPERGFDMGR